MSNSLHYGIHLWNICDKQIIQRILTCNVGDKFMSDPFKICDLTCKLLIFPNGKSSTDKGNLILFLSISSIPSKWNHITLNWSLKCIETMSQVNGISSFPNNNKPKNIRWSNRVLLLNELQTMHKLHTLKSITFEVTINILQIQSDHEISYHFQPISSKQATTGSEYKLSWHINENMMDKFRSSYFGKRYSQSISITNMWSIGCFPFGFNQKWYKNMSLSLQLNYLPVNVKKMKIKFIFKCPDIEYEKYRVKIYSMENQHFGIVDFCESNYLQHLDTMDFIAIVKILKMWDMDGNEIINDGNKQIMNENEREMKSEENENTNIDDGTDQCRLPKDL